MDNTSPAEASSPYPEHVLDLLLRQATIAPLRPAFTWWQAEAWRTATWLEVAEQTSRLAQGLQRIGVQRGDRVGLLAENSFDWILFDLALQAVGAVSVPFHTQMSGEQVCEQLQHSGSVLLGVSSRELYSRVAPRLATSGLQTVQVCCFEFPPPGTTSLPHLQELGGNDAGTTWLRSAAQSVSPDDLLTILYTSGTTGDPKGVMLSHRNILANAFSKCATLPLGPDDLRICWLPLSHIFARVCDLVTGLLAGCHTVISRGRDFLFAECRQFRPTYLNGVPYFYDRCYRELEKQGMLEQPGALQDLLGGRIQICNCGGAPLADHVFDYFRQQEIGLVTGYGLTEAAPVVTSNRPTAWRRGTVGQVIPGVEIRLAADGEVLVRGENVMSGYYRNPEATARALSDGWLRTGDLGRLDEAGYLTLDGRKDDLIVLNTAKKVYPAELENLLLASPYISQCCVVGHRRNFLVALISVDHAAWQAASKGEQSGQLDDDCKHALLSAEIKQRLASRAAHEQLGGFHILREPFAVENGLLTAKQSMRRKQIQARYAATINELYQQLGAAAQAEARAGRADRLETVD